MKRDDPGDRQADRLMTVREVAELLRLTPKGVYSLVERRQIPFIRVSNRLRFRQAELIDWLNGNRVLAQGEE